MTSREKGAPQESVNDANMTTTTEKLYGASRGPMKQCATLYIVQTLKN